MIPELWGGGGKEQDELIDSLTDGCLNVLGSYIRRGQRELVLASRFPEISALSKKSDEG